MARIEDKLRTAAMNYTPLTALLGSGANNFRWYETQLLEGSAFPAVVVTLVSNVRDYALDRRMATSFTRLQIVVWDPNPEEASTVEQTIVQFLDQFSAYGPIAGQAANFVLNSRATIYPDTQPPIYQRLIDVRVFDNELVN
ncbi:MAG TPA: hypothetical protein VFO46_02485 [Candidatus Sulfotelmatobacter sp.]|nr:hypothetical protein [Candidatus Sulfotelmatobacter sp.]